jgi:hypothetical protein
MLIAAKSSPAMLEGLLNRNDLRLSSTRVSTSWENALAAYLAGYRQGMHTPSWLAGRRGITVLRHAS